MLISLVPVWESQQPHFLGTPCGGEMLDPSAVNPGSLRMLSASSSGTRSSLFDVPDPLPLQWTMVLALVFA